MMLFVTTAPICVMSMKASSSLPAAAQPDAVNSGLGRAIPARSVDISTVDPRLASPRRPPPVEIRALLM